MHINWIGKSSELKLHCFCLFDAYSKPKDTYSTPLQDSSSFSIMIYYTFSNTYQKIGDLFWPVHISGLSHSVSNKSFENILKLEFPFAFRCSRCKWVQKLWLSVLLRHLKWDLKNSSNHKILFLHNSIF